jgi:hypothetical protein
VERVNGLFHLDNSPAFSGSLLAFSSLSNFVTGSPELSAAEKSVVRNIDFRALVARDDGSFRASGLSQGATFETLSESERARYIGLWSQSAFSTRRRFYGSVRAVTFIALYSMPEIWPAISYAGPLIHRETTA